MSSSEHPATGAPHTSTMFDVHVPCDADWCVHHEVHPDALGPGEYEHWAPVGAPVTLHLDGSVTEREYTARIVSFHWSGGTSEQICLADAGGTVELVLRRDEAPAVIRLLQEAVAAFDAAEPRTADSGR